MEAAGTICRNHRISGDPDGRDATNRPRIFLHSQWIPHVENGVNLWRYPPLLWSILWDQKNVELSRENPLRSFRARA